MDTLPLHREPNINDAHHWLARFAVRLMALCPDVSLRTAVARGAVAYAIASDLTPEDAAQIDAEAALPEGVRRIGKLRAA